MIVPSSAYRPANFNYCNNATDPSCVTYQFLSSLPSQHNWNSATIINSLTNFPACPTNHVHASEWVRHWVASNEPADLKWSSRVVAIASSEQANECSHEFVVWSLSDLFNLIRWHRERHNKYSVHDIHRYSDFRLTNPSTMVIWCRLFLYFLI